MLRPPSEPPASRAAAGSTGRMGAHPPNPRTGALLAHRCGHPRSNGRHGRRRPGGGPWLPKRRGSGPARSSAVSASVGSMPSSASKGPRGDRRCRRPPAPPARGRLRSLPAGIRRAARRGRFGRKPTGFPTSRALSAGCLAAPGAHVTFFTGYQASSPQDCRCSACASPGGGGCQPTSASGHHQVATVPTDSRRTPHGSPLTARSIPGTSRSGW